MTVSDTRTKDDDRSGDTLIKRLKTDGHILAARAIVKDDSRTIEAQLKNWIENPKIDVVISTGGTGVTGRDVTPCLLYTSPSPRDRTRSRMPSSA